MQWRVGEKCAYQMGLMDKKETRDQLKTLERKEEDQVRDENRNKKIVLNQRQEMLKKTEAEQFLDEVPDELCDTKNNDKDFNNVIIDNKLKKSLQNRNNFPNVAAVSLR
jgi:hypothetical protein